MVHIYIFILKTFISCYTHIIRIVVITIVDVMPETIPVNIAKLVYVGKTNVINLSSLVQCCDHPRNNFWL